MPVEPEFDQPLRCRRAGLEAALPLCFTALLVGDPPASARQVPFLHPLQEAEQRKPRRDRVVHMFDSRQ